METATSEVLFVRLIFVFLASCFALFVSRIAWKKGYYLLPPNNSERDVPKGKEVFLAFSAFFFIEIILAPFLFAIFLYFKEGKIFDLTTYNFSLEFKSWTNILIIFLTSFVVTLIYAWIPKKSREAIWGSPSEIRNIYQNIRDFLVGSMTWIIVYPWIIVIGQLLSILISLFYKGPLPLQTAVQHLKDILNYPILFALTAVSVVTIIPYVEEMLFRGFLQAWLKTTFNRSTAIIATSIIFASFHFSVSQGIENVEFIASLFLLSCFLGFLKERQRSLWASIGLHSTFNAISICMLLV
jgi:membrane protease YdiL (CAAX protease family)